MQDSLVSSLRSFAFERGVSFQSLYQIQFKPNLHFAAYYPLLECRRG